MLIALLLWFGCDEGGSVKITGDADPDPVEDTDAAGTDTEDPPTDSEPVGGPGDTEEDTDPGGQGGAQVDPPVPADPCGRDLDAHNGTASVRLARVPQGGVFQGDPNDPGAFQVIRRNGRVDNPNRGRDAISVTSYVPSIDGQAAAVGPFPLVIMMPGFGASYTQYGHFTEHLASHGFVVVGLDFPSTGFLAPAAHDLNALEAVAVLDWAVGAGPFAPQIDATKVAAVGHSLGGKISFYAASLDPRIDIVVGWDPQNSGGPPCNVDGLAPGDCNDFPVAPNCEAREPGLLWQMHAETLVFAAEDGLLTPDAHLRASNFYRGAPSPAHYVHLPDASHAAWVFDGAESAVSRRVHTALLLTRFYGMTGLESWLPGGADLGRVDIVDDARSK